MSMDRSQWNKRYDILTKLLLQAAERGGYTFSLLTCRGQYNQETDIADLNILSKLET